MDDLKVGKRYLINYPEINLSQGYQGTAVLKEKFIDKEGYGDFEVGRFILDYVDIDNVEAVFFLEDVVQQVGR